MEIGGIVNLDYGDVKYIQLAGIANVVSGNVKGFQGAGILNTVGGNTDGVQLAGIVNFVGGDVYKVQGAGIGNAVLGNVYGVQAAGIYNFNWKRTEGAQLAGIANYTRSFDGAQAAGIINTVWEKSNGLQLAGIINAADSIVGGQVAGITNVARYVKGVQLSGHYQRSKTGRWNAGGIHQCDRYHFGCSYWFPEFCAKRIPQNRTLDRRKPVEYRKFQNRSQQIPQHFHGKYAVCAPTTGSGQQVMVSEQRFKLSNRLNLDLDITGQQLQVAGNNNFDYNLLSKFYVGVEWQFARKISLAAGPTLNWLNSDVSGDDFSPY